jgi:hypothetical protein
MMRATPHSMRAAPQDSGQEFAFHARPSLHWAETPTTVSRGGLSRMIHTLASPTAKPIRLQPGPLIDTLETYPMKPQAELCKSAKECLT